MTTALRISDEIRDTVTALVGDLSICQTFVDIASEGVQKGNEILILLQKPDKKSFKINRSLQEFEESLLLLDNSKVGLDNLKNIFQKIKTRQEDEINFINNELKIYKSGYEKYEDDNKQLIMELEKLKHREEIITQELQQHQNDQIHRDIETHKHEIEFEKLENECDKLKDYVDIEQQKIRTLLKEKKVLVLEIQNLRGKDNCKTELQKKLELEITSFREEIEKQRQGLQESADAVATVSLIRGTVHEIIHQLQNWRSELRACLAKNLNTMDESEIASLYRSNELLNLLMTDVLQTQETSEFKDLLLKLFNICVEIFLENVRNVKKYNIHLAESLQNEIDNSGGIVSGVTGLIGDTVATTVSLTSYIPIVGSLLIGSIEESEASKVEENTLASQYHDITPPLSDNEINEDDHDEEGVVFWNPVDLPEEELMNSLTIDNHSPIDDEEDSFPI